MAILRTGEQPVSSAYALPGDQRKRSETVPDTLISFAAVVFAVGLNVTGLIRPSFSLPGVFLMPVLAAIGLRYLWSGSKKTDRLKRD
jgi:hypothetical protein